MADERVATEILTTEGYSKIGIHIRLKSLHVEDAIDVSSDSESVVSRGHRLLAPQRPTSQGSDGGPKERVDGLIRGEGSIRTIEMCAAMGSSSFL
jgi:hypothetical protein